MQVPTTPYDFTEYTSPDHFGALLKWLRDRHGLAQTNIVGYLPPTIDQQRYSSFELDKRFPLFDELPPYLSGPQKRKSSSHTSRSSDLPRSREEAA